MTLQFVHLNLFVVFSFGEFIWLLGLSQKLFIIKLISSCVSCCCFAAPSTQPNDDDEDVKEFMNK